MPDRRGKTRPVRVANCSGYHGMENTLIKASANSTDGIKGDPAYEMYRQATLGDVDFITGDYLAGSLLSPMNQVPSTN